MSGFIIDRFRANEKGKNKKTFMLMFCDVNMFFVCL